MNGKRFGETERNCYYTSLVFDNQTQEKLGTNKVVDLLNKQQATIITLKKRLEKINGGYGHLTHRNGLTANEWLIESQERELKKKNEQISDWIEQHSKNIVKICEQQAIIKQLEAENEQLKKARDESDEFIAKKGLEVEFLNWCVEDE